MEYNLQGQGYLHFTYLNIITGTTSISSDSHLRLHGLVEPLPLLGCDLVNHTVHLRAHHCNYCVSFNFLTTLPGDTMTGSACPRCPTSAASRSGPRSRSGQCGRTFSLQRKLFRVSLLHLLFTVATHPP